MNLSLMSPEFLGLSLAAAVLLALLAGAARQTAFLAVNLLFLWALLLGPEATASTVLFTLLGYALARLVRGRPGWFWPGLVFYTALFVYLRRYSFLEWVAPREFLWHTLSTIGLSFLFFKAVHVLIEARSGTLGPLEFPTYLNYCLNFTTFLSGPIQRYQDYSAQWHGREAAVPLTFEAHLDAVLRILVGLVKAYVIADRLLPLTEPEGPDVLSRSLGGLLVNVYAYYFFLYLNFSGYCDVAIGVGGLLGIRPPENFDKPFLARNVSDYWSRWHRSLTVWLTSYIFSPAYRGLLSGGWFSARPLLALNLALLLTMLVSGLWHGTTLNFLLWGTAHGVYLIVFRTWEALGTRWLGKARLKELRAGWLSRAAGVFLTFNVVAFTLILFRFEAGQAFRIFSNMPYLDPSDHSFLYDVFRKLLQGL